ncbi:MAG TPA: 3-hydroxyacyl-CoA dehydrogenase family protein, partial [Anaerolineales bacterium]|nr:3-hydroxyacyl-CoA dehydrogenase family protein [Anaerolineales bacterium]
VISAATAAPARVAGLHFFNPAPVLPLVEVVRGSQTSAETITRLCDFAVFLGKSPVVTRDSPGFIVNRVARPFYGEALRMLAEGVAGVEEIDLLAEAGAGFRMGPFRLMDLIGIDVNYTAMRSMYEQTFGEPRYRPHWIQASMAASGALGRKSGRGFYAYDHDETIKSPATPLEAPTDRGTVWLAPGSWAPALAGLCHEAGYALSLPLPGAPHPLLAILPAGRFEGHSELLRFLEKNLPARTAILCQAGDQTLSEMKASALHPERLVGFDGLFIRSGGPITLTRSGWTLAEASQPIEDFVRALGCTPVWVEDSPALVLPRLLATLVNEATFAVLEQVADSETVDLAMRLGVSYPKGPIEWGREIGLDKVLAILEHLRSEYGEERYRASTLLRRTVRLDSRP